MSRESTDNQSKVPSHVQKAFPPYIALIEKARAWQITLNVTASKLLIITKDWYPNENPSVSRKYFSWHPDGEDIKFTNIARASFIPGADSSQFDSLWLNGEYLLSATEADLCLSDKEFTCLSFRWSQPPDSTYTASLYFCLNGRRLDAYFNSQGNLQKIPPFEYLNSPRQYPNWPLQNEETIGRLMQNGPQTVPIGKSRYNFAPSQDQKSLSVLRLIKGKIIDELTLPLKFHDRETLSQLFDPETIEDPVNAAPELDHTWRSANLLRACNVRWIRYPLQRT